MQPLTPELLLSAYARGYFPMARDRDSREVHWFYPEYRGILPLGDFHVPRRLKRSIRQQPYRVTIDHDFAAVMRACAEPGHEATVERPETWINGEIERAYTRLHHLGFAHSVECRDQGGLLLGGLYGVAIGGAFFGESMFSRARDASKIALVHLVARLKAGGFRLLDAQFYTEHLSQFGAIEVPRDSYLAELAPAVATKADFYRFRGDEDPAAVLQSVTQIS